MAGDLPFEFNERWADLSHVDDDVLRQRLLEDRDRQLEDFLAHLGGGTVGSVVEIGRWTEGPHTYSSDESFNFTTQTATAPADAGLGPSGLYYLVVDLNFRCEITGGTNTEPVAFNGIVNILFPNSGFGSYLADGFNYAAAAAISPDPASLPYRFTGRARAATSVEPSETVSIQPHTQNGAFGNPWAGLSCTLTGMWTLYNCDF